MSCAPLSNTYIEEFSELMRRCKILAGASYHLPQILQPEVSHASHLNVFISLNIFYQAQKSTILTQCLYKNVFYIALSIVKTTFFFSSFFVLIFYEEKQSGAALQTLLSLLFSRHPFLFCLFFCKMFIILSFLRLFGSVFFASSLSLSPLSLCIH